jgi:hypothetical protein
MYLVDAEKRIRAAPPFSEASDAEAIDTGRRSTHHATMYSKDTRYGGVPP